MAYKKELKYLTDVDPKLGELIKLKGKCTLELDDSNPFESLCRAIIYQQLSGKAAGTINGRFKGLYRGKNPSPKQLLKTEDDTIRSIGISRNKMLAIRDLAQKSIDKSLNFKALPDMDNEDVIQHLIQVRGIGRWTAEMFLMFTLGRMDVFSTGDLGLQKAIQQLYGYKKLPAERTLHKHANQWKPYRTIACWYLWRLVDDE